MNPSFRSLVIDLLDNPHGISEPTYQNLLAFADRNYPGQCDDVWAKTDSAEDVPGGLVVWLNEDDAEELRNKA
jgi:hypothetical protein